MNLKRRINKLLKQYTFLKWESTHETFNIFRSINQKAKGVIVIEKKEKGNDFKTIYFNPPNKFINIETVINDLESQCNNSTKQLELKYVSKL